MVDHTSEFRLHPDGPSPQDDAFARAIAQPLRADERAAPDFADRLMAAVRAEAPHQVGRAPVESPHHFAAVRAEAPHHFAAVHAEATHHVTDVRAEAPHHAAGGPAAGLRVKRAAGRPWWLRERQLRASPLTVGAVAAGFAAVVSFATLASVRAAGSGQAPVVAAAAGEPDTVHLVRFVLVAPDAQSVSLVGDFNAWEAGVTQLRPVNGGGSWTTTVPLPAGRHEYAFIVEDSGAARRWSPDPFAPRVRDEHDTHTSVILVGNDDARRL